MLKLARRIFLPLLLANVTIAANGWHVLGVELGQVLFWMIIALAGLIVWHSPYRIGGTAALGAGLLLRFVEAASGAAMVQSLRQGALAVVFILVGAIVYGRRPWLLSRQLVLFLALCVPVMLLQITGAHSFFMVWDTDYAHDTAILDVDEIGTFKEIPVYPTLFVGPDDLHYQIGQGRPSGLLYANNVLSVFVAIVAGLTLGMARSARLRLTDLIVGAAIVLTMSMTAMAAALLLYAAVFVFGPRWRKWHVVKAAAVQGAFLWLYFWLFPGLFSVSFSSAKMLVRLYTRGLELFDMIGMSFLRQMYERDFWYIGEIVDAEATYSGIARLLRTPLGLGMTVLGVVALLWYLRAIRAMRRTGRSSGLAYATTGLMCILTQFGVAYYGAASFQCILGFAMFPLFRRLWQAPAPHRQASSASEFTPAVPRLS